MIGTSLQLQFAIHATVRELAPSGSSAHYPVDLIIGTAVRSYPEILAIPNLANGHGIRDSK
jgi:hypothetical protein